MNMNINFDYPKTENDIIDVFKLNNGDQINFEKVKDNLKKLIGLENYETFFKITNLPEPNSVRDYLELTNNIKWSIEADWRNPFIGISSLSSSDTIPVVDANPQICKYVLDKVAEKDKVALKHMRASGISKKDMTADYDIFKMESYYTFIELVADDIRNTTLQDTFAGAIHRNQLDKLDNTNEISAKKNYSL